MKKFTKKVWIKINIAYRYKKYFVSTEDSTAESRSSIPKLLLTDNKVYLYSGKQTTLFKVREEISGFKFGELMFTRKYRPAKYRKSKKKK